MLLKFMALLISLVPMVSAQQTVLHQGDSGNSQSVIVTARTRAFLSCESGDIVVKVNFTQPFRGLMYAHRSRNSPCRVHGTGGNYYQLRIPLKGCGTWQETPRVFVNNVTIRFHPALELEEDETKTVVCRYPPPLTQPPGTIQVIEPPTAGPNPVPTRVGTARLSEVEILIIICLLLFLSLLTLGIGIAYFCLKRRNIHIVRKSTTVTSSAPPSQITRLSSSNVPPPSSLLSSVLGHTVRIPRAVPYSAPVARTSVLSSPDHQYEEYPISTSTGSGESTETSVSSSSEDPADASKQLLFKKAGGRSLLSIPKAILRKTGSKKRRAEPTVHHYPRANTASVGTSARRPETEDQTFITVLEPEGLPDDDQRYWTVRDGIVVESDGYGSRQVADLQKSESPQKTIPVYAQVHKSKKSSSKNQEINLEKLNISKPQIKTPRMPGRPPPPLLGAARRQRALIADIPEESSTSEEITKNTTVTTSVRREVTETRIVSPTFSHSNDTVDGLSDLSVETDSRLSHTENIPLETSNQDIVVHQPPKNILIRDVSDVYLTTTVETESREYTTRVSRDIVEEHVRTDSVTPSPKTVPDPKTSPPSSTIAKPSPKVNKTLTTDVKLSPAELKPTDAKSSPEMKTASSTITKQSAELKPALPTDNWNVVIRQRQPPPSLQASSADSDTTSEISNAVDKELPAQVKPMFDVKIRTIPPDELSPKEPQGMVTIPPLEMPQTVSMLKEALMPKTVESSSSANKELPSETGSHSQDDRGDDHPPKNKDKSSSPQRTVRWVDNTKSSTRDKDSTVSSSDSFQSAESLRERSSSEVLEVAPTLSSQRNKGSDHPMLERSTSEIVTNPEEHVRWVGGVVPVLESLSPEFLANIPVVLQGGFFNQQRTPSPKDKDTQQSI